MFFDSCWLNPVKRSRSFPSAGGIDNLAPMALSLRFLSLLLLSVSVIPLIANTPEAEERAIDAIEKLGGLVYREPKQRAVVEVKVNGIKTWTDQKMNLLKAFPELTDISLEGTPITGKGLAPLSALPKLEWINLWETTIDDAGLTHLKNLKALQALPIGRTKITDVGLVHLKDLSNLSYLGLRETAVTDEGVKQLARLPALTEINLRGTRVTDACIDSLLKLGKLQKVWLGNTKVTADGVARLKNARPGLVVELTK